ncbi:MAG: CotH kinase family protein [Saprospiraceae bacterium]|nr:CotH kinase family protein [Saprospiraceae bacterium]
MSYFEDGNEYIHQDVEIQIHGGKAARTQAQKPFRITARNALGTGTLNHQFIKTQENNQYKKIVLRNSGGDFNRFHFRDAFLHNLMIEDTLDIDLNAAEPCVLYLNGQYWGVMNIREKIGKSYIKETYGVVDDADITILEEDTAIVFGTREEFDSMIEWIEQTDFSQAQNYDSLEQLVDVKSFADYIIAETYWNNTDWPANNLKYWTREGGKWRFILFDLDVSLNTFGWVSEETDNLGRIIDDFQFIKTVKIFTALLENAEWKHHFVNRYADLMNTAFEAEHVKKELYNLVDYVEPEMYRHFELYPNSVFWWNLYDIDDLTVRFIDGRPSFARDYVEEAMELEGQYPLTIQSIPREAGLFALNTIEVPSGFYGIYFEGNSIRCTAKANQGYSFVRWENSSGDVLTFSPIIEGDYNEAKDWIAIYEPIAIANNLKTYPNPIQNHVASKNPVG